MILSTEDCWKKLARFKREQRISKIMCSSSIDIRSQFACSSRRRKQYRGLHCASFSGGLHCDFYCIAICFTNWRIFKATPNHQFLEANLFCIRLMPLQQKHLQMGSPRKQNLNIIKLLNMFFGHPTNSKKYVIGDIFKAAANHQCQEDDVLHTSNAFSTKISFKMLSMRAKY